MEETAKHFLDVEAQENPVAPGEMPSLVHRLAIRSVPYRAGVMELHRRYEDVSQDPISTHSYRAIIENGRPVTGESLIYEYSGNSRTGHEQPSTIRLSDIEGENENRRILGTPLVIVAPISNPKEGLRIPIVELTVSDNRNDVHVIVHMRNHLNDPVAPTEFSWLMRVEFSGEGSEQEAQPPPVDSH